MAPASQAEQVRMAWNGGWVEPGQTKEIGVLTLGVQYTYRLKLWVWWDSQAQGAGYRIPAEHVEIFVTALDARKGTRLDMGGWLPLPASRGEPIAFPDTLTDGSVSIRFRLTAPSQTELGLAFVGFRFELAAGMYGCSEAVWTDYTVITASTPNPVRVHYHADSLFLDKPETRLQTRVVVTGGSVTYDLGRLQPESVPHEFYVDWDRSQIQVPDGDYVIRVTGPVSWHAETPISVRQSGSGMGLAFEAEQPARRPPRISNDNGEPSRNDGPASPAVSIYAHTPRLVAGTDLLAWDVEITNLGYEPVQLDHVHGAGPLADAVWRPESSGPASTWLAPGEPLRGQLLAPIWLAAGHEHLSLCVEYRSVAAPGGLTAGVPGPQDSCPSLGPPVRCMAEVPPWQEEGSYSTAASAWGGPPRIAIQGVSGSGSRPTAVTGSWSVRWQQPGSVPWTSPSRREQGQWLAGAWSSDGQLRLIEPAGIRWAGRWQEGAADATWENWRAWEGSEGWSVRLGLNQGGSSWEAQVTHQGGARMLLRRRGTEVSGVEVTVEAGRWSASALSKEYVWEQASGNPMGLRWQVGGMGSFSRSPSGSWSLEAVPLFRSRFILPWRLGVDVRLDPMEPRCRLEWGNPEAAGTGRPAAEHGWLEVSSQRSERVIELGWNRAGSQLSWRCQQDGPQTTWSLSLDVGDATQSWHCSLARQESQDAVEPSLSRMAAGVPIRSDQWQWEIARKGAIGRIQLMANWREAAWLPQGWWRSLHWWGEWESVAAGTIDLRYERTTLTLPAASTGPAAAGQWQRMLVSWTSPEHRFHLPGLSWNWRWGLAWAGRWGRLTPCETSWYPFVSIYTPLSSKPQ
ncbi:MAG: hypothetical protein IMX01_05020 [Limnochordaceae bacterium]|nr:hypothetical protein [Limnochordaceae bacterium]